MGGGAVPSARVRVRAHPGARRDAVAGRLADGTWKASVTAAPEGGAANAALERLLSRVLGVAGVRLVRGTASRSKVFEVPGMTEAEVERRLALAAGTTRPEPGEAR
jgi:uncharacterized protein YggU (UPF0235/DUF167 family)